MSMVGQFADRREAGRQLAAALERFRSTAAVVLGLPRGGVPVAYEIATALELPLDVYIVRKLGVPGHRELAMGAIASGGTKVIDDELIQELGIPEAAIAAVIAEEERELAARERLFATADRIPLEGRTVILVDDGLATGSTMRAAVRAVRQQQPAKVVVAVPVGAPSTCKALEQDADEVVCLQTPEPFSAVGLWYRRFDQTPDDEVRALLAAAHRRHLRPH
jgi:predicted phosphoribosyltransferase